MRNPPPLDAEPEVIVTAYQLNAAGKEASSGRRDEPVHDHGDLTTPADRARVWEDDHVCIHGRDALIGDGRRTASGQ